jgi:hypothetical protein
LFDIINNLCILTAENKIAPMPHGLGGDFWMRGFSDVIEEFGLRGRGQPSIADLGEEFDGFFNVIPNVEDRLAAHGLKSVPYLVKFSKRKYNEDALRFGRIRISPASTYDDDAKLRSIKDRELERTTYRLPVEPELLATATPANPVAAIKTTTTAPTDYFTYCASLDYSRRLFHDFRADSCLLIYDVRNFLSRIMKAVAVKFPGFFVDLNLVEYFDPFACSKMLNVFFTKPFSYAYQREYRVIWSPPDRVDRLDPFFIEIGALGDCAELIVGIS